MLSHEVLVTLEIEIVHVLFERLPVRIVCELVLLKLVKRLLHFGAVEFVEPFLELNRCSGLKSMDNLLDSDMV